MIYMYLTYVYIYIYMIYTKDINMSCVYMYILCVNKC